MSQISPAERLESLKAGIIGGGAALVLVGSTLLIYPWVAAQWPDQWAGLTQMAVLPAAGISGAIATLAGFLFGVTYRYVIRQDPNPHLKSGAVLAFGLVRGLAQVDAGLRLGDSAAVVLVLLVESLLLFAIARLALDGAIQAGWVRPFGAVGSNAESLAQPLAQSQPQSGSEPV